MRNPTERPLRITHHELRERLSRGGLEMRRRFGYMEQLRPDDLEEIVAAAPVAFVPLGTYEHHGWHLPVGFDGVKAQALCGRVAERTGGVVLAQFWYGIGVGGV